MFGGEICVVLSQRSVQEGCDLTACTGIMGGELSFTNACGDAVFHGPNHSVIVIYPVIHIGEICGAAVGVGLALCAIQEGGYLPAGTGCIGGEGVEPVPLVMPFSTAHSTAV